MSKWIWAVGMCGVAGTSTIAQAQVRLDRADPSVIQQSLPPAEVPHTRPDVALTAEATATDPASTPPITPVVQAVTVHGRGGIPAEQFASVIAGAVGRTLTREDLSQLAGAIADVAKRRGYPLATATVEAQTLAQGVLRVALDLGRVDAVRVIGAKSPLADAILARALVTGGATRTRDLERAILLVGDIPGIRVKESRFTRQDGFGILLVTIVEDRASGYLQIDNRGSDEVGPVRSTALASFRNLAGSGDELALIASNTPLQPTEFSFVRGRYSAPVGSSGAFASASASYGRSNPGGSLKPLDVIGESVDVGAAFTQPLVRSRSHSLWAGVEFRGLSISQTVSDASLRDDRLALLTATVNGTATLAEGTLRAEFATVIGLPFDGVTRSGDPRSSRFDGDGRFVTGGYLIDWTRKLGGPYEIVLASAGQIASRPLLATAEIGAGGPGFGRAYDYAERTGDQGILGSVEVRAATGRVIPGIVDRSQLYGFVDGGVVSNLRGGVGGGSLASLGGGARFGTGHIDGMVEVAVPLNADRFDTQDRSPRISLRIARLF